MLLDFRGQGGRGQGLSSMVAVFKYPSTVQMLAILEILIYSLLLYMQECHI